MSTQDRQANFSRRPFSFPGTASRQQQQEQEQEKQHQRQIRSRFVEGSMSDRASAAPPVAFLGPESTGLFFSAAGGSDGGYQQQQQQKQPIYARHSMQSTTPYFSRSGMMGSIGSRGSDGSSGSSGSNGSNGSNGSGNRRPASFLAPLWDGVRWLHRRRRGGAEASVAATASAAALARTPAAGGPVPAVVGAAAAAADAAGPFRPAAAGGQPLSDDIVANYQQLMQSGFFRARAIPATRQGLTRGGGGGGRTAEEAEGGKARLAPAGFARADDQCQAEMAKPEMAEAGSAVVPARSADEVLAVLTQSFAGGSQQAAALATLPSPTVVRRGTKRGHADVESAEGDRCDADRGGSGGRVITTARSRGKLVKKLRKTASRTEGEGEGEGEHESGEDGEDREKRWGRKGEAEGYGSSWRTRSMRRRDAAVSVHQTALPARQAVLNKRSSKGTGLREREQEQEQEQEQELERERVPDNGRRPGGPIAAVVVHQDGEGRQRVECEGEGEGEDEDEEDLRRWAQPREQQRQQRPLQPVHIQRPLQPLRPLQSPRQGATQKPICFHYPQRVRMPPLQPSGGGEHKPVQARTRRMEDTENLLPMWED